jgi:radical SAM protein with 4Fe4S-binding SPASM domain
MHTSLSTNATLADDDILLLLAEAGLSRLQVSIDGPPRIHDLVRGEGTFEKAKSAILFWQKQIQQPLTVSFTLGAANVEVLSGMVNTMIELCNPDFSLTMMVEGGRAKIDQGTGRVSDGKILSRALNDFFDIYRNMGSPFRFSQTSTVPIALVPPDIRAVEGDDHFLMCSFPFTIGVDSNGRLAACDGLLSRVELQHPGITPRKNLQNIWEDIKFASLRAVDPINLTGVCSICKFRNRCCGGCRAAAIIEHGGDYFSSDPICQAVWDAGCFPDDACDSCIEYVKPAHPLY